MLRRKFIKSSTLLFGASPFISMKEWNSFYPDFPAEAEVFKMKIGKFKCTVFRDRLHKYVAQRFFTNAAPDELNLALHKYNVTPDNIPSPFIAVLLQQGDKTILIDTGLGALQDQKGHLHRLLLEENISQSAITDVIITHFHPDHIGGIFSEDEKLLFPNARFHMHEDEWNYWHSSQSDNQDAMFKTFVAKNITRLKKENLHLIKGDFINLLPGITAVKAEGHTPGQIALVIHSKKEHLLYISDAFLHPLHIERLDWQTNYDLDHQKARQSRIKLLDLAYKEDMLVNAFHFDFPGLGRVDKKGSNWIWKYTVT